MLQQEPQAQVASLTWDPILLITHFVFIFAPTSCSLLDPRSAFIPAAAVALAFHLFAYVLPAVHLQESKVTHASGDSLAKFMLPSHFSSSSSSDFFH